MKRAFDILFSGVALVLLAPVFVVVALVIKMDSPGPVFYRSVRIGRRGRPFSLTKFRTMVQDANRISDVVSTPNDDPRITKVGHILRHLNIDEMPQFFDVLRGAMSVVGPRPDVPQYVALLTEEEREVLSIRPGITDWASLWVGDKGERLLAAADPEAVYQAEIRPEKIRLQLVYVRKHSMMNDLRIIARTAKTHILDRLLTFPARRPPAV